MAQFDFRTQVQDPFTSALRAVQLGSTLQQAQAQRQKAMLDQQALQQALERQNQFTTKANKILQGGVSNATAEDFAELSFFTDKDTAKTLQDTWQNLNKDKQTQTLQSVSEVVSALANNNPEIAEQRLLERANRLRETNLPENIREAEVLESQAKLAKDDPEFLQFDLKYKLATLPGGQDYLKNVEQVLATRREEALAPEKLAEQKKKVEKLGVDIGLTKAQTNEVLQKTKKLSAETQKAILELEATKETGGVDPAKKFDQEAKIRSEYQKRTGQYQELKGTFQNINSSAAAQTGPGDIALITSFMKMLDPGSVVRETEFATARDTAGLYAQLENNLQKAKDGKFLNPKQRGEYVSLARKYLDAAEKQAKQEETNLRVVVKNYKLNPENIFGAGRESVVVNGVTYERPASFTDEQWQAYKRSQGAQ